MDERIHNLMELIHYRTITGLRSEASKNILSFFWWIIEPVLYMLVFYVVFGYIFKRGSGEHYVGFLMIGLVIYKWFTTSITSAANSICSNVSLMSQVYVPKIIFPIMSILHQFLRFLIVFALLLIFLNLYGLTVNLHYLELIPLITVQLVFMAAIGFFLAAIIPFIPDFNMLIPSALQLLFFMSGIFFSADSFPESYQILFYMNPMYLLIDAYRDILMLNVSPMWGRLSVILVVSILIMLANIRLLNKFDRVYPKIIV